MKSQNFQSPKSFPTFFSKQAKLIKFQVFEKFCDNRQNLHAQYHRRSVSRVLYNSTIAFIHLMFTYIIFIYIFCSSELILCTFHECLVHGKTQMFLFLIFLYDFTPHKFRTNSQIFIKLTSHELMEMDSWLV